MVEDGVKGERKDRRIKRSIPLLISSFALFGRAELPTLHLHIRVHQQAETRDGFFHRAQNEGRDCRNWGQICSKIHPS